MKLYQLMWDLLLHTFNLIIVGAPNDDVIQQFHKTFNVSGSGNEPQNKNLKLIQVVHEWHSGKRKFLTVSVKDIPNFYIRILDIKNFQNNDTNELVPNSLAAMSFYSRVRESSTGVFQDSCHSLFKNQAAFITPSTGALSGLSVTAPTASQFLISVDQRIGFLSFAASSTFLRLAKIAPSCSA